MACNGAHLINYIVQLESVRDFAEQLKPEEGRTVPPEMMEAFFKDVDFAGEERKKAEQCTVCSRQLRVLRP